ncbi:DUF7159 family protein [Mycolicibacterium hippocampi]|uniref:DUF7159 domain-containing protein n=1 Tax=Mycolicibacterium hippocampi TaxID=659824 RepID=A0A7I9ZJ72_9MYCO|nr:hypothetical protein [Mycolicibacterium hippocampi]GFH01004.1 hypothetical protein MHIP_14870 [Mycolicibacterium hippocampi]
MDIVLGVSMTPTTVRMVLVEGENADGVTVDHDVFDVASGDGTANTAAGRPMDVADQVLAAVLGTRESAQAGGHHLKSIGVAWSDHAEAAALRDALAAHDIDDVMLVSEGHAASSLAQAVGRAVGYDTTALLFVNRDTATLSVVQTDDGSVVKVLSRTLHSTDAMAVLTEMAEAVAAQEAPPQAMFVVGSGVDVSSVKAHLEHLVSLPVSAPEDAEMALARGAALASAAAPAFEASTVGLAYSQDPDGPTAGSVYAGLAGADTQLAPAGAEPADMVGEVDEYAQTQARPVEEERKPFLLVGSALTSIFVVGVVALVISLAVSIRPTADQRPSPAEAVIVPSSQVPAPEPVQEAQQPVDPPSAETIKPPVPVVQQAPAQAPRTVFVEQAPAPAAPAPAPAPAAPPPAPAPVAPPPVVAPPVVVPPPVIVLPQPEWPRWQPPWERDDNEDEDASEAPTQTATSRPTTPRPTTVVPTTVVPTTVVPTTPRPTVPQVPQQSQWPLPGSGSGSSGGPGSGSSSSSSGRGSGDSGSSRGDSGSSRGDSGSSGSGVPGDLNGDGCFLVFCSSDGGRG